MLSMSLAILSLSITTSFSNMFDYLYTLGHVDMNSSPAEVYNACTAFKVSDDKFFTARHCISRAFFLHNNKEILFPESVVVSNNPSEDSENDWAFITTRTSGSGRNLIISTEQSQDAFIVGFADAEHLTVENILIMEEANVYWGGYGVGRFGMSGSPVIDQEGRIVGLFSSFSPENGSVYGRRITQEFLNILLSR